MKTNNKIARILKILIIGVQTFTACGKGDPKLLESITDDNGKAIERFEYDDKNRIVKVYEYMGGVLFNVKTIAYSGDDLVTVSDWVGDVKFAKKGNTITSESDTLTINGDGYIVKNSKPGLPKPSTHEYKNGNLVYSPPLKAYSYDDKKSRFSNTSTPKWLVQLLFGYVSASKNNVRRAVLYSNDYDYKYEYDGDGFPIKEAILQDTTGKIDSTITHYAYCIKTQCPSTADIIKANEPKEAAGNTFKDERDGKYYKWVKIGKQTWMAENLSFKAPGSKCYGNDPKNCAIYGRLYDFETAETACPKGWYLPSSAEWKILVHFAGGKVAGKKLKAKSGWNETREGKSGNGTDDFGFSALPGFGDGEAYFPGECGYWWSNSRTSWIMCNREDDATFGFLGSNSRLRSIRCIKEAEAEPPKALETGSFTDERDGKTYKWVKISEQIWMAENLNYDAESSKCYDNNEGNCETYGRLYNWAAAKTACPSGFHLPAKKEWDALTNYIESEKGETGKYLDYSGENTYGFSALPGGFGNAQGEFSFAGLGGYYWWSATEYGKNNAYRLAIINRDDTSIEDRAKSYLFSVRCVGDNNQMEVSQ